MSSLQYHEVVFSFLSLTELTRFSVKFCVVKFSSFGERFDGLWNKEWQEPKLGYSMAPQGKIQGHQKA